MFTLNFGVETKEALVDFSVVVRSTDGTHGTVNLEERFGGVTSDGSPAHNVRETRGVDGVEFGTSFDEETDDLVGNPDIPLALRYFGGAGKAHMDEFGTPLETFAKIRAKASRHAASPEASHAAGRGRIYSMNRCANRAGQAI